MARGIPNRLPQWQGAAGIMPLRIGPINTDFATMTRPEWRISDGLVPYDEALATMEARVADIRAGRARRARLAAGASAALHRRDQRQGRRPAAADALSRPCRRARRAIHLSRAGPARGLCDARPAPAPPGRARASSGDLEEWTIRALARFNVRGRAPRRPGRRLGGARRAQAREDKIAAIGVRIRHWVSFHGLSINLEPDLSHYRRHRALRHRRARRDLAGRSRPARDDDRSRHGAGRDVRRGVRPAPSEDARHSLDAAFVLSAAKDLTRQHPR